MDELVRTVEEELHLSMYVGLNLQLDNFWTLGISFGRLWSLQSGGKAE